MSQKEQERKLNLQRVSRFDSETVICTPPVGGALGTKEVQRNLTSVFNNHIQLMIALEV